MLLLRRKVAEPCFLIWEGKEDKNKVTSDFYWSSKARGFQVIGRPVVLFAQFSMILSFYNFLCS